jgi:hypothetical protein
MRRIEDLAVSVEMDKIYNGKRAIPDKLGLLPMGLVANARANAWATS